MTEYSDAIRIVSDFTEGLSTGNEEYERGQLELLADMFGKPDMETDVRMGEIAADVRAHHARELEVQVQVAAERLAAVPRTVSFHLVHEPSDDPEYEWQCRVTFSWLKDGDQMPRQENGHGKTADEAFELALKIASAFMFEKDVAADNWPPNSIDSFEYH